MSYIYPILLAGGYLTARDCRMNIGYAWEKMYNAVLGMAVSPATLQERIADAYTGNIIRLIYPGAGDDLPEDIKPMLAEIKAAMETTQPTGSEGTAVASALAMTDAQAEDMACKITRLFDEVQSRHRA